MKNVFLFTLLLALSAGCTAPRSAANGNFDNLNNRTMTNISSAHEAAKPVSAQSLFKGETGTVTALQILKDGLLDKHVSKVPALLVCVAGQVAYEDENGLKQTLHNGDYVRIAPMVTHWVRGLQDSQLLLIK